MPSIGRLCHLSNYGYLRQFRVNIRRMGYMRQVVRDIKSTTSVISLMAIWPPETTVFESGASKKIDINGKNMTDSNFARN